MGVVYRATHLGLERQVALKVIARELADREGFRERFLRESRLAASLDHPAVVPVFDSREVDGELIVAMRLVAGGDLRRTIDREGPLPPARAIALLGPGRGSARRRPRRRHRPPRRQAAQRPGRRRPRLPLRLRPRQGARRQRRPERHLGGRHRRVHVAGAVARRLGRAGRRRLLARLRALRGADRDRPLRPQGSRHRAGDAGGAGRGDRAGGVEGPGRPLPQRRGADRRRPRARGRRPGGDAGARPSADRRRGPRERATVALGAARRWRGAGTAACACRGAGRWRARPLAWRRLVAIVLLVLSLVGGDGIDVSEPIPVGAGPLRVAAAADAIWVTSEPDGTLTQLDPESGEPVGEPIQLGAGISGVAVGAGSVWVTDPRRGEILRVDPTTGGVVKTIAVGGHPGPIAFGADRVWVADEEGAGVTAVNAKSGEVFKRGLVPHAAPLRLAVGAGGLWVTSASTGAVRRIDLGSGNPGAADPGRPRPRRRHRRPRPGLGRQQPRRHRLQGRSLDRPGARRPDRSRRPPRRHRRRHHHRLGRQRRRGRRHPDRPRERRAPGRPDRRRLRTRRRRRRRERGLGSRQRRRRRSPASNPDSDGPKSHPCRGKSARRPAVARIGDRAWLRTSTSSP